MAMSLHRTPLLLASILLAGCANFAGVAPGTPAAQLEPRFGAPAAVWKNADGSETWEYPRGPLGLETYMITIGPDRAVREVRQVLDDEYVFKVHPGMTRDEVRRLLGRPGEAASFDRRDEEVWSWRYQDTASRFMILHVVFDRSAGTVRTSFRIEEDKADGTDHGQ